jgi:type IV secretion system protein VirB9
VNGLFRKEKRTMKSRKLTYIIAFTALIATIAIVMVGRKVHAANYQSSTASGSRAPHPEAGAPPDANYGETLETPNQQRRRLAAEAAQAVPSPQDYPFTEAIRAIQAAAPNPSPSPSVTTPAPKPKKTAAGKLPATKAPPASPTASDALMVSDHWQNTRDTPAEGRDGRVVYSEGGGMPTVVCAPLRLCVVELETGERLTGEPQIGDSVRWSVEPASYGSGELATPMIVLKPKAVGLDTNLVITTDRRSYYLRLMSSSQDYLARVAFDYPETSRAKWSTAIAKQEEADRAANFDKGTKTLADSLDSLNVDYRLKGDARIRPLRVFDDGVHTYLQMNPAVLHREAPVLAILGPDGKAEMVNYRVQGSVYVVDRLFDRGRLILGSGRKALKADIFRGTVKAPGLFARDPFRDLSNQKDEGEAR